MSGRLALAALVLVLHGAHGSAAEEFARVELPMPCPAGRGQAVELQVTAGPLPRGSRLVLSTEAGEVIGAVAPFPPGAGTRATVPVPQAAAAGECCAFGSKSRDLARRPVPRGPEKSRGWN